MLNLFDFKPNDKIVFIKDFKEYFVLRSACGWAVTEIPSGTSGKIKEIWNNSLIIELEDKRSRTIWTRNAEKIINGIDYLEKV